MVLVGPGRLCRNLGVSKLYNSGFGWLLIPDLSNLDIYIHGKQSVLFIIIWYKFSAAFI